MFHVEHNSVKTGIVCPICRHENFITHLELKDYFLSEEQFSIIKCTNCGLLITHPQPDNNELGKYYISNQYLSHAVNNGGLEYFLYNRVRNITLAKKLELIKRYAKGNILLDIGCATGVFLNYCKSHGFNVSGIEPSLKARQYAIETFGLDVKDIEHINDIPHDSQDVITMWHVLEHVADVSERIALVRELLKKDGTSFIALPNPNSYDALFYKEHWAAYDVPRHLYHFSKESFEKLVKNHGFEVVRILPMVYDSYYISLMSERYKKSIIPYFKAFYRGLKSNAYAKSHDNNYSSLIYVLKKA